MSAEVMVRVVMAHQHVGDIPDYHEWVNRGRFMGDPIRKHERAYVLLYTECQKISFPDDKDGNQIRVAHLHPQDAFWISPEDARGLVVKQAAERERRKAEIDGQEQLFAEQDAAEREQLDETGSPEEIAAAAGQRAKQKP